VLVIVKRGKKFQLISRKSGRVLGTHDTEQDAYKQEYAIQKNMDHGGEVHWPPSGEKSIEEILDRQVFKESRFNPLAESPAGARGLAQIMPGTESYMKEKGMIPEDFDAFNPEDSKMAQRAYMESLLDRSWNKGSEEVKIAKALAAYNFGPTAVVRTLNQAREDGVDIYNSLDWLERLPLETRDYVSKILGYNEKFESEYYDSPLRSRN
jgi:membrane-bound lytic murein transglycosylase MltF|tara:strand:+ start:611 stop:1237 length:627 start_codon:yes stop_codon:yes gene_type:complete